MLAIQTFKWFIIGKKQKIDIPFKEAFKINLISNFYGFITPSKLGTIVRIEYLKKFDVPAGKGLCNFTLDKILDISSIIFMAILFSFVFKDKLELPIGFFIILFVIFILATIFFIKKERNEFLLKVFYRKFIPKKMKEKAKLTFDSFYDNMPKKRYFALFFLLNILTWTIIYLINFFIAKAIGIDISFIYFLAILPIGTLVAMLPISVNGFGTREATLISLFSLFGISAAKVFSMSILGYIITGIIPAIVASFLIFRKKL